ncbi:hypothetical protein HUN08_01500 [Gordonia sp. X0973]|uniref:putative toxin n=1 Tax=Gordonia sp. X0973 TaxID=2742602 RepID=UPI000F53F11E|nr:putative toxin [Gordonia sp. X0973]QKT06011.1 hypothetical protein HUN08_01500 [Gordonia sp. X0973]
MTDVDPDLFYDVARVYRENSEEMASAIWSASIGRSKDGSGDDRIGSDWGKEFDSGADELGQIAFRTSNVIMNLGGLLRQNGINHDTTESASDLNQRDSHGAPVVPPGEASGTFMNSGIQFGSVSGGSKPIPEYWTMVSFRFDGDWPNGNGDTLTEVADRLKALGNKVVELNDQPSGEEFNLLDGIEAAELETVTARLGEARNCSTSVAAVCGDLGRAASDHGTYLKQTQTTITAILDHLGPIVLINMSLPEPATESGMAVAEAFMEEAGREIDQLLKNLKTSADETKAYIDAAKAEANEALVAVKKLLDLVPRNVAPTAASRVNDNRRKGSRAERIAGIDQTKKTNIKVSYEDGEDKLGARTVVRIPDELDEGPRKQLREVKNVKVLHATQQLRDMLKYAKERGLTMVIVVDRGRTKVGGEMQKLIDQNEGTLSIDDTMNLS